MDDTITERANEYFNEIVVEEIKKFHVDLNVPTTTLRKSDPWPNIESCNLTGISEYAYKNRFFRFIKRSGKINNKSIITRRLV
jgi:hypothetical protein